MSIYGTLTVTAQKLSLITHFFFSFVREAPQFLSISSHTPFWDLRESKCLLANYLGRLPIPNSIFMPTQMTQAPTQNSSVYLHIFLRTLYHLHTYLQAPLCGLPYN